MNPPKDGQVGAHALATTMEYEDNRNHNEAIPSSATNRGRTIRRAAGYVVALACLVWVFHDLHVGKVLHQLAGIKWGWIVLAVVVDTVTYLSQGLRWRLLLQPIGEIKTLKASQAIYAGLFSSEVLPLRIGELVRGYLVSRWLSTEFVSVIPSMVVERLFDGIWLAIGVGITMVFLHLPKSLMDAVNVLGCVILLSVVLFVIMVLRKQRSPSELHQAAAAGTFPPTMVGGKRRGVTSSRFFRSVVRFVDRLANGVRDIGRSRSFYLSLLMSSSVLICQIAAFWMVVKAYGLPLSLWSSAAVVMIVTLGTVIPNAPSNVGTYQFFCVVGLSLFGIDKTTATGFSVVVFIVLTAPLWVIGMYAISRTGMTLKDIRRELASVMGRKKENAVG